MARLLILGGTSGTISLIKRAKELNHYVAVIDQKPDAIAKGYADISFDVSGYEIDKIIEIIRNNQLEFVLLGVAEKLMAPDVTICKLLNLPCYSTSALFEIYSNKKAFREKCIKYNVPTITGYIEEIDNCRECKIKYPVILKPTDECGSRGIKVCYNDEDFKTGIKTIKEITRDKNVIIEKYLSGKEIVAYYSFQNGKSYFTTMCDRYVYKENEKSIQLPECYIYPSKYTKHFEQRCANNFTVMFKETNVKEGSMFLQGFVDNDEFYFYESGYRLNGAQEHIIVSSTCKLDVRDLYLEYAIKGDTSAINVESLVDPYLRGKIGCKLSPLIKQGVIKNFIGLEELSKIKEIIEMVPNHKIGDSVKEYGTLDQIAYRFFIVTENIEKMKETIGCIVEKFDVINEKGESLILHRFDAKSIDY